MVVQAHSLINQLNVLTLLSIVITLMIKKKKEFKQSHNQGNLSPTDYQKYTFWFDDLTNHS